MDLRKQLQIVESEFKEIPKVLDLSTSDLRKFNKKNKPRFGKNLTRLEIVHKLTEKYVSKLKNLKLAIAKEERTVKKEVPPVILTDSDMVRINDLLGFKMFKVYDVESKMFKTTEIGPVTDETKDIKDDIIKKVSRKMPRKYPYYVQGKGVVRNPKQRHAVYERRAVRITSKEERKEYVTTLLVRMMGYRFTDIEELDITVFNANFNKQRVISVAKYQIGNCLLNLLNCKLDAIYSKYPHLASPNPTYIKHDEIDVIAKKVGISITAYSKLGAKLNLPWQEFGYKKSKRIHVEFSEGHATIIPGKITINEISYDEYSIHDAYKPNVVDRKIIDIENPEYPDRKYQYPAYYVTLNDKKYQIHKEFRPSSVTNNPIDDTNIKYAYCVTPEQVLTKMFRDKYNLTPTPPEVKDIVKSAEHFVGRKVFSDYKGQRTLECDANKHYCSYRTNKYYNGFPVTLTPTKFVPSNLANYSFIHVTIANPPLSFQHLVNYTSGPITITQAVYRWLKDHNITVEEHYAVHSLFQDIDILGFTAANVSQESAKLFRNSLIGRLIAGGVAETKKIVINACKTEREQLLYECDQLGFTFQDIEVTPYDDCGRTVTNTITIDYKHKTNAVFHFHAFILGYALTSILDRWEYVESKGATVYGFNVDSLTHSYVPELLESSTETGKWKVVDGKLSPVNKIPRDTVYPPKSEPPTPELKECKFASGNILILGAGGIGKSYAIKNEPYTDQLITTPTRELRDEHKKMFQNTTTHEKQYHLSKDICTWNIMKIRDQVQKPKHVVIDEVFMMCEDDMEETYMRAKTQGSTIIAIGDDKQICSEIGGRALSVDWFVKRGFTIINMERSRNGRHSLEYGTYLDSYRNLSIGKQKRKALDYYLSTDEVIYSVNQDIDVTSRVIAGDWKTCKKYNDKARIAARNTLSNIWCKRVQTVNGTSVKNPTYHLLDPDNPQIFWDKTAMNTMIPVGFAYIPIYATTIDSFQGKTHNGTLYIDLSMTRYGTFYTAITRTRIPSHIILVSHSDSDDSDDT